MIIRDIGIALGIGALVGLERQRSQQVSAGIRTFALITTFGALTGLIGKEVGSWVIASGLLCTAMMMWLSNQILMDEDDAEPGMTTEMSALVMFCVGAAIMFGYIEMGVVVGGTVALLLHWKAPLKQLVQRMGEADFRAIVRLILIGMVILPILPNQTYGPYNVLNPYQIWLMVVLIVGISMAAYVAQRLFGLKAGSLLGGMLGGLISSTATTVSYAGRSKQNPAETTAAAIVIVVASTIVFARVILEIAVVAPTFLRQAAPPLAVLMGFMALMVMIMFAISRKETRHPPRDEPPKDLKAAISFGLLYALILFAVAAVKEQFGNPALYLVAAISGLTDVDAITLSTAQLVKAETLEQSTGWRIILVGVMANLIFKGGAAAMLGTWRLFMWIGTVFGLTFLAAIALLLFWPG